MPVRRDSADADARGASDREGRGADAAAGDHINPWPFVVAAYGIALGAAGVLAGVSWLAMRKAEK